MEIYCHSGKRNVDLPKSAFNQELMPEVKTNISPCVGCKHAGHLNRLEFIKNNKQAAEEIGNQTKEVYDHAVFVLKSNIPQFNDKVLCTCNCTIKITPKS